MTITPATHAISINPATGEQLSVLPWAGVDDIENALQLAAAGFRDWRETNIDYRAEKLRDIGKALRARSEEMAQMITREMGKPINQARAEVAKSANLCDWYAEHGPAMLKAEPTLVENQQAVIEYRPLGTILAIMPWNFPLWQVMRGAVPIILAGNGYLLKHAPNVMGCAQLVAQVFKDAGIPQGVYGWLNADNDGVSQMIKDSRIAAVTVTGSVRAGAAIGAQAGAALKKCVLELPFSIPQMFSARLGIATMAICPIMVSFSVAAINSLMKQVALRADFDFLTQVYSRSGLYEALKSPSLKQTQHLTVMLLDIDYFKSINDNYGHECGDKVLSVFAQHIQKIVGDKGLVARMGGEEFAVAVPSVNPVDGLLMAEKIRKGVELQPFTWQQKTLYLTVSIGVGSGCASYRTLTDDFNKLMVEADTCLYRSKKDGRNRTSTMRYGEEVV
ncbi:TPA: aldehyde dehydrogenase family protein [Escherichia coli]